MDYGRIKQKSITKVVACMQTANKAVSSNYISKTVCVNSNTVEKILDALISEGKVAKMDTSGGMMYLLAKRKE